MNYKIIPLNGGDNAAPFDMSLMTYRVGVGEYCISNGSFAIQGDGEWILVDAGVATNEECAIMGKPAMVNATPFPDLLKQHNIDPNKIKTVILTHLHWDHSYNLDKLPNATIYVQREELNHAIYPYKHERSSYGFMGVPGFETPRWMRAADRIVAIKGEVELLPGILCVPTPGHTHGSQSVLVDTKEGTYALVGDFCYTMQNWDEGLQVGVFVSSEEWYDSYARLKKHGLDRAHIITTHDHLTYQREIYG